MHHLWMKTKWQSKAKEAMFRKGITQDQIAEKLGKSKGTVSNWFHGRHPPAVADLKEIAKMLGLSLAEMLSEDDCLARNTHELAALRSLREVDDRHLEQAVALISAVLSTLKSPQKSDT